MQPSSLHVVQVISSIDNEAAGSTPWIRHLVQALRARDVSVEVLSLALSRTPPEGIEGLSLFYPDRTRAPWLGLLLASQSLKRAIASAGVPGTVLHSSGLWRMPNIYPGWTAARTGCPLIVSPHGMLGSGALQFSALQKKIFAALFQNRSLAAVTCFHATSSKEVEDIRSYGLKAPVALIENGIEVPRLIDTASSKSAEDRHRTLLYLGRLHPKKGLDRLIAAWARLEGGNPAWRLRIVGPSERGHGDDMRRQVQNLGLERVSFHDGLFGEEKAKAYRDADLFVLPTLDENFGMVVTEALANGTPVVCTKGAPWKGLITNGCGWWVDHGVEPLVATIGGAMKMPRAELKRMGLRGRDWMIRDFSWTRIAGEMEQLYRWCNTRGEPPPFVMFK